MLIGRSVLGEVARNFLASLAVTTGIAFFTFSVTFLKRTPGVGIGFLAETFPLFFPITLQFTVPIALLSATILTFSRMAGDGELTALNAAGISVVRTALPVLALASVIALAALLLTDVTIPFAAARLQAAKRNLPAQLQTSFRSGLCDLELGRAHISFESYDNGSFVDVCVEVRNSKGQARISRARSGSIVVTDDERVVLTLKDARSVIPAEKDNREVHGAVGDIVLEQSLSDITGDSWGGRHTRDLTAVELAYVATGSRRLRAGEELARRSAFAASPFFFVLAGIPVALLASRGGRVAAFLLALGPIVAVYFPVVMILTGLAHTGQISPFLALWSGNLVLLVAGGGLFFRMVRR